MSRPTDDDTPLDEATWRALDASHDLLPTSETEVAYAERALPLDLELPEALRHYRRPSEPEPARPLAARRAWLGYAAAASGGAMAAALLLSWLHVPPPPVTSAGGELVKATPSASTDARALNFRGRCESECCAGSSCRSAQPGLSSCPSGISCVGCAVDNANSGPYRLRVGGVIPSQAGQQLLPLEAPLELCFLGGTDSTCVPALIEPGGETWRVLKAPIALQDLLSGLGVELRKRGDKSPLASWRHAIASSPEVMCKGLMIQLSDGTETLGRVSAFLEPTHFLELAHAATVPPLLRVLKRVTSAGVPARVFETSRSQAERFVLVLGPTHKQEAETLRWQALDQGIEARLDLGLDYLGSARPSD